MMFALLLLLVGANFKLWRFGNCFHPLAQLCLVVQQVGDVWFGVFVFGAPEECVKWAHFNADAAIHAQCVVDVETVEHVDLAWLATLAAWRCQLFVRFDIDAPVGARARAQHARGAVVLVQGNDTACANWRGLFFVRILHGV